MAARRNASSVLAGATLRELWAELGIEYVALFPHWMLWRRNVVAKVNGEVQSPETSDAVLDESGLFRQTVLTLESVLGGVGNHKRHCA